MKEMIDMMRWRIWLAQWRARQGGCGLIIRVVIVGALIAIAWWALTECKLNAVEGGYYGSFLRGS